MPAESVNDVIDLTGTLSMVADRPNEISLESQHKIASKSSTFINVIQNDQLDTTTVKTASAGVLNVLGKISQAAGDVNDSNNTRNEVLFNSII